MTARPDDGRGVTPAHAEASRRVLDEIALALDEGQRVACREDPDAYWSAVDDPGTYLPVLVVRCAACPARSACRELAEHEGYGVWGGVEGHESRRTREQTAARGRARKAREREARQARDLAQ